MALLFVALQFAACSEQASGGSSETSTAPAVSTSANTTARANSGELPVIFVVAMENQDADRIYGNSTDAPYINDALMKHFAHANGYENGLKNLPSEPHYVLMEAGTTAFRDNSFKDDGDPSVSNSTASTEHLVSQIRKAGPGIDWMTYQEGINAETGACPIKSTGFYAAKHNPFVFFQDVAGNPPSMTQPNCASHNREYGELSLDLVAGRVAAYNFISPNLCHDMHGAQGCPDTNAIRAGDNWLKSNLPPLIDYVNHHHGVIFLVWDEGSRSGRIPFLAIGPGVKVGYSNNARYDHTTMLRSIEEMLHLGILDVVAGSNDLRDLFVTGEFP